MRLATAITLRGDFVSVGAIALSTEVPFIFGRQDPHGLCVHEVFFKEQSCHRWLTFQRQFSMSAITANADIHRCGGHVR
jgi:sarcosine oxidase delta subunit